MKPQQTPLTTLHPPLSQPDADLTPGHFLTPEQLATKLDLSIKTLAVWRCTGRYALPYIRVGGRIRYRRTDVDAWLSDRQRTSTAVQGVV